MNQGEQRSTPRSVVPLDVELEEQGSDRWHRTLSSTVSHSWPWIRVLAFTALFCAFVACCLLLVAVGYPTWRPVAFACVGLTGNGLYF